MIEMTVTSPGQWRPFLLVPSADEQGRPEPEIFELGNWDAAVDGATLDVRQRWPVNIVVRNLVHNAVYWHLAQPKDLKHTIGDDIRRWIADTVDLSGRLPYSGEVRDLMLTTAMALKAHTEWRARYFVNPTTEVGTKRDTDARCSENLWALDTLIRAMNAAEADPAWLRQRGEQARLETAERVHQSITSLWRTFFEKMAALPVPPAFAEYEQAQRRIKRVQADLKPDHDQALMADILRHAINHGHFGPDGHVRKRPQTH